MSLAKLLPGGLQIDGQLVRHFGFKPVVGELEVLFADARTQAENFPSLVTEVLSRALQSLAGAKPTAERVKKLSVGDRQFLVVQLAAHLDDSENWVSAECSHCGEKMDLSFRYRDLPVKTASEKYPCFEATIGKRRFVLRTPTGEDQEELAAIENEETALFRLINKLVSQKNQKNTETKTVFTFSDEERKELEHLIEDASPEVGTHLLAQCPHCQTNNTVAIDIYQFLKGGVDQLMVDVHDIAMHYHWSEQEILRLPKERRKRYLTLIDKSRGMVGT